MNFQKIKDEAGNVTYKYVSVGRWETGLLSMNDSIIYWPSSGFGSTVESVCSDPCAKGSIKVSQIHSLPFYCACFIKCHAFSVSGFHYIVTLDYSVCKIISMRWRAAKKRFLYL